MQSKVVSLNIYTLIQSLMVILATYMGGALHLSDTVLLVMIITNIVLSEVLNYFTPSGEFVGTGKNWDWQKWVGNIAISLLAIAQSDDLVNWIPQEVLLVIVPIFQTIIRIFGGANRAQVKAAAKKY